MLKQLTVRNYALIDSIDLEFSGSFNILTGETGAGKTIIIEAIQLLLGARASAGAVRKNEKCASITAVFEIDGLKELSTFLKNRELLDTGEPELILRREIDASGKSKSYCNDKPITLSLLEEIGNLLIDIHGQHDHQLLLKLGKQLDLLDSYGGLEKPREELLDNYSRWLSLSDELRALRLSREEREQKTDLYKYQLKEIDSAKLKIGEDLEIAQLLPMAKNSEKITALAANANRLVSDEESGALKNLQKFSRTLGEISNLSADKIEWCRDIDNIISQLKDISYELEHYTQKLNADPGRLEELVDRNDLILRMKKKYGSSIEEIIAYRDRIKAELEKLQNNEENINKIQGEIDSLYAELSKQCAKLSLNRKKAAARMEELVEKEIKELGMPKTRFKINIEINTGEDKKPKIGASGWDRVEFLFAPNIGEDLKPLKDTASGGEMSRCMLALKTVLGKADGIPTMIFDEIDAGVSGPVGQVIGRKLFKLSKTHQVFCITHLAQIASFGSRHIYVNKFSKNEKTCTSVEILEKEKRINEIARMLSGQNVTPTSIKHARELLNEAGSPGGN